MEAQHRAADGQPKVNGGHATGACWAPQAVHRDRRLHCTCYFNRGPKWTPSRPPARRNQTGYGVAVLNCMQEFKNRPSGSHQAVLSVWRATCWRLFPLFNSGPTCLSLTVLIWIYMYDIVWSIRAKLQAVRQRAWSASTYALMFSQDFWRAAAHAGD
jgi:hypothetical protein